MKYYYLVLDFPNTAKVSTARSDALESILSMEQFDFHANADFSKLIREIEGMGLSFYGLWHGGMFGLSTNQMVLMVAQPDGETEDLIVARLESTLSSFEATVSARERLIPTVRPKAFRTISKPGVYIFRWIKFANDDWKEYVRLCELSWPRFEETLKAEIMGVWRASDLDAGLANILMLTWYRDLTAWEETRIVSSVDQPIWRQRASLEICHWGAAARLAI